MHLPALSFGVELLQNPGNCCLTCVHGAGVFLFFGMWHCLAGLFVYFLLPETRGIPLEQVSTLTHVLPSCGHCFMLC